MVKENEEYYRRQVATIISDRQRQIDEAIMSIYGEVEPKRKKIMRKLAFIFLIIILIGTTVGLIFVIPPGKQSRQYDNLEPYPKIRSLPTFK